jgi:excisionase family DNA binding protein
VASRLRSRCAMTLEAEIRRIVRDELAKVQPANDQQDYLSIAEAAAFARVSAGTVRRWVRAGELTRHEAGARVLVKRAELEAFIRCEVVPIDSKLSPEDRARRRFG